ncbi:MAG: flagellar biosynthetic protein FliR [Clostridiales bacterium]|nr:flagellar biosynthetic protein FliR [Clostridiales bacterium]
MQFTIEQIVYFICILVRISTFVYTAPFFSLKNIPQRVKVGLSIAIAIILFEILPYEPLVYVGVIGFASLVIKEALAGLIMGLFANICAQILTFAGGLMDMEIGFSMVQEFDPMSATQVTITAHFYQYAVMLIMFITNLHHYIVKALVDSFTIVPLGKVVINVSIYEAFLEFIINYFLIGFRIVLPIFASLLIVNTVLAILAKVAPQMNMFVIGMQLKVLVGITVLLLVAETIPTVADFIFTEMIEMLKNAIAYLKG